MAELRTRRCFHHPAREAAARCPACGRFYCHECIAEHEERVLCADCLARETGSKGGRRRAHLGLTVRAVIGLLMVWFLLYGMGRVLLALPSAFHDGHMWAAPAKWMQP